MYVVELKCKYSKPGYLWGVWKWESIRTYYVIANTEERAIELAKLKANSKYCVCMTLGSMMSPDSISEEMALEKVIRT